MSYSADAPIYVFNHIPRTGGGALLTYLLGCARVVQDYPAGPTDVDFERWAANPVDVAALQPGDWLCGHYTSRQHRLHQRYPEILRSPRYRLCVLLREPWSWVSSSLRYFHPNERDQAAAEAVVDDLAGLFDRVLNPDHVAPAAALGAYWFVGLTEDLLGSCRRLAAAAGLPPPALQDVNRTDGATVGLSESVRRRYESAAASDYALYREAVRRARADS